MPSRPECRARRRAAGLALPLVVLLVAITATLLAAGLGDAAGELSLARTVDARQRAFDAAERGIAVVSAGLRARDAEVVPGAVSTLGSATDGLATTRLTLRATDPLPDGYSHGEFVARHYEITSRGTLPPAARVTVVQGMLRIEPGSGTAGSSGAAGGARTGGGADPGADGAGAQSP